MPVCLTGLRGLAPRLDPYAGNGIFAEIALNVDLSRGRLDPWRMPSKCTTLPENHKSAFIKKCKWRSFESETVSLVDSVTGRCYISNPCDECTWFYKDWCVDELRPLGVPRPETPELVNNSPVPTDDDCWTPELVHVRITYLNDCYEESRPSRPSNAVKCKKGDSLTIIVPPCPDDKFNVQRVCVYISQTTWDALGQGGSAFHQTPSIGQDTRAVSAEITPNFETNVDIDYFKILEIPKNTNQTAVDFECDTPCGKRLATKQWYQPKPNMCISGESESGSLVGWTDEALMYSVRNKHHAWPTANIMTFGAQIEYVCSFGLQTLVLTCDGNAFLVTDDVDCTVSEAGACRSVTRLGKVPRICLDKFRSHKAVYCDRMGVLYPSREGLIRVGWDGSMANLTSSWIHCRQWEQECLCNFSMAERKGMLFMTVGSKSYVLDINMDGLVSGEIHQANLTELSLRPRCWISDCDGDLYLLDCDGCIYQFDSGSRFMEIHYKTGPIPTGGLNFNTMQIDYADTDRCTTFPESCGGLAVYADGKKITTKVVNSTRPLRMRRVTRAHTICLEYRGRRAVRRLCLGGSLSDIGTAA